MMNLAKIIKPKVCVISDLHLGVHSNSTVWHEIAIEWAKWLKSELNKQNIKDIIFCGDWHHNRSEISVNTLQVSADILNLLQEFNIIAIVGNHDLYYKHRTDVNSLSIFKNRKNIAIFESLHTLEAFDKVITLCPWNTSPSEIPKSDIIFGHFEIETFKMNGFKLCENGLKIKDLLGKSSLIISGHFHTRHEKKFGKGTILYCGNPFQMDFGDLYNDKGYYILDIDTLEYEFYKNTISPIYEKLTLSEIVREETITDDLRNRIANNIVKIKIDKNISKEDLSFLVNKFNSLKPVNLSIEHDITSNRIHSDRQEKDLSGIDISQAIQEFVKILEIENKEEIIEYTVDLYKKCSI